MGQPPLVRAVAQVVFLPSAHLATAQGLADLQEALGGEFRLQGDATPTLQISIGINAPIAQRYSFAHHEGYDLVVTPTNLTLSIDERYRDRDAFQLVFEHVLHAVGRIGKISEYERIGVRYINAAPATIEQFLEWFKPEFTGWAGRELVSPDTERAWMLMTQLNRSDDSVISASAIRYGYLPKGVGADVTRAAASAQPSFVADIDMTSAHPGQYEPVSLGNLFRTINHEIAAFFEQTLSSDGIKHFELTAREK